MNTRAFYVLTVGLIILNAYLLSKPNLLGKVGLFVYKYYYLRSFPRTLLTVCIVCGTAVAVMELIAILVKRRIIGLTVGSIALIVMIAAGFLQLVFTGIDFSSWTYSHTGLRFRLGAFMLPTLVILIFTYGWLKLPRRGELPDPDDHP